MPSKNVVRSKGKHARSANRRHASLDVFPIEILLTIFIQVALNSTGRTEDYEEKISSDLFNLRLANRKIMVLSTWVLNKLATRPEFAHHKKIILPRHRLTDVLDVLASDASNLKGFATSLEIRTYRTLPSCLTLPEFRERMFYHIIDSDDCEPGEMEELYATNERRDIAQQGLAYSLAAPNRQRFLKSLFRCLPDSFPVMMVQRQLSFFAETRFLELSPFTVDTQDEDLPANTDMGIFAMLVPFLPYKKISHIHMNVLADHHEMFDGDIKLRSLTIALNDMEASFWKKYWTPFLERLPDLEYFCMKDRSADDSREFTKFIHGMHFKQLRTLVLDNMPFDVGKLFKFLQLHLSTLKEVKLLGHYMEESQHLHAFLMLARSMTWTQRIAWTITECSCSWDAAFLETYGAYIFNNWNVKGKPRDVGRYLMA